MNLVIAENGQVQAVHSDELDLSEVGSIDVRRASHVEWVSGAWEADLSPVGGPKLGPFSRRCDALAAEHEWLERWLSHEQ